MADDNFNRYCEQLLVQFKRRNTNLNCLLYYIGGFLLSTHIFITTGIVR